MFCFVNYLEMISSMNFFPLREQKQYRSSCDAVQTLCTVPVIHVHFHTANSYNAVFMARIFVRTSSTYDILK